MDPTNTNMHGIGSSGATQMTKGLNTYPRIAARMHLFISPPSTPLGGSHNMHKEEAATQVGSGGGGRDDVDDLTNCMVDFPKARCVTSTGNLYGQRGRDSIK